MVLVWNSRSAADPSFDHCRRLAQQLWLYAGASSGAGSRTAASSPLLSAIWANFNDAAGNTILGRGGFELLHGQQQAWQQFGACDASLGPGSFVQVGADDCWGPQGRLQSPPAQRGHAAAAAASHCMSLLLHCTSTQANAGTVMQHSIMHPEAVLPQGSCQLHPEQYTCASGFSTVLPLPRLEGPNVLMPSLPLLPQVNYSAMQACLQAMAAWVPQGAALTELYAGVGVIGCAATCLLLATSVEPISGLWM